MVVMDTLDSKLNEFYAGKVVRKDLTKSIKEGANVPSYVLEYLLGMYCATDNDEDIERGVAMLKQVLANNFVRPDEAEKIKPYVVNKEEDIDFNLLINEFNNFRKNFAEKFLINKSKKV